MSNPDVPASPPDAPTASALSNLATFVTLANAALFAPLAACAFLVAIARYEPILPNMLEVVALGSAAASLLTSLIAGSVRISGRTAGVGPLLSLSSVAGVAAAGLAILFCVLFEVRPNLIVAVVAVLWPIATGLLRKRVFERPFPYSTNASLALTVGAVCLLLFSLASCCSGIVFSNFMGWTSFPPHEDSTADEDDPPSQVSPPVHDERTEEATGTPVRQGQPPRSDMNWMSPLAHVAIESESGIVAMVPQSWGLVRNETDGIAASFGDGERTQMNAFFGPFDEADPTRDRLIDDIVSTLPGDLVVRELGSDAVDYPDRKLSRRLLVESNERYYLVTIRDLNGYRFASIFIGVGEPNAFDLRTAQRVEASLIYTGELPHE